jgi:hypothetical protein
MNAIPYKGFTITPRTYQVRGSGRWTLDLLIGQRELLRAFSGTSTYPTELAAVAGCVDFAHHLIDSSRRGCALADLKENPTLGRVLDFPPRGTRQRPH